MHCFIPLVYKLKYLLYIIIIFQIIVNLHSANRVKAQKYINIKKLSSENKLQTASMKNVGQLFTGLLDVRSWINITLGLANATVTNVYTSSTVD